MKNNQEDFYICPSFNSYSSGKSAEIAVRVAVENSNEAVVNEDNDESEDFEFALVREDNEVVDEEFLYGDQIGPIFPVFNRNLLLDTNGLESASAEVENLRIPLGKIFIDNRDVHEQERDPPSCSSSEADELESIPHRTYCIWRPKAVNQSPSPIWCKKSKSTGSASKPWKFRDLLRRSNSEGKDSFVFLTPKQREEKSKKINEPSKKTKGKGATSGSSGSPGSPSAHEALYVWNRTVKEGNKKKSFLPYRQDLVGFFANVNGLSRSPFPRF